MTFRKWLKENYAESNCPTGELYQAMKLEDEMRRKYPKQYPQFALWKSNYKWLRRYLIELGAPKSQRQALLNAWREYKRDVKEGFA